MAFKIRRTTDKDDLEAICAQMQPDKWAADNQMTSYKPEHLQRYLRQNGILLLAFWGDRIAGTLLGYDLPHPDGNSHFYVHELDTHPDFRRQGVATQLMNEALALAKERGASELWLGTEEDNEAAKALYQKFGPSEVENGPTYSYKIVRQTK